ncbi:hypothetical protein [Endozoicomonas ascidiicola]|uniref:hypothetical protein n=1 Tax=Endozoicomonas ascidiicola TaxID=1698521 RepID=UPI00082B8F3D|nr:hypothetical protein [Endozoicomonas ascidiicola]
MSNTLPAADFGYVEYNPKLIAHYRSDKEVVGRRADLGNVSALRDVMPMMPDSEGLGQSSHRSDKRRCTQEVSKEDLQSAKKTILKLQAPRPDSDYALPFDNKGAEDNILHGLGLELITAKEQIKMTTSEIEDVKSLLVEELKKEVMREGGGSPLNNLSLAGSVRETLAVFEKKKMALKGEIEEQKKVQIELEQRVQILEENKRIEKNGLSVLHVSGFSKKLSDVKDAKSELESSIHPKIQEYYKNQKDNSVDILDASDAGFNGERTDSELGGLVKRQKELKKNIEENSVFIGHPFYTSEVGVLIQPCLIIDSDNKGKYIAVKWSVLKGDNDDTFPDKFKLCGTVTLCDMTGGRQHKVKTKEFKWYKENNQESQRLNPESNTLVGFSKFIKHEGIFKSGCRFLTDKDTLRIECNVRAMLKK